MGVYIPNMSKPKNCRTCKFKSNKEGECWFVHYDIDCPLIDLVRCGECKKVDTKKCPMYSAGWGYTDDDWCSEGERRADE